MRDANGIPGAHWQADSGTGRARFRLVSHNAEAVELCLYTAAGEPMGSHALDRLDGGLWEIDLASIAAGQLYGYRVHGPWEPSAGHRFNPAKLLADPYASAMSGEPPLHESLYGFDPNDPELPDSRDSGPFMPKSIVVDSRFDWEGDRSPRVPWSDTVLYECHVRGMTIRHPEVRPAIRGTYLGLASEAVIDHLRSLGVTSLELLPVQQIASEPGLLEKGLTNYFGYSPLGFLAPNAGYATTSRGGQVAEFKEMVKRLHRAELEVILDVVFNHSAEGDHRGRTLSLRGIDNRSYYRLDPSNPARYEDLTGCANTLDARHEIVLDLILDALSYWVDEMHVDGFRFDLAPALARDDRFDPQSKLFERIRRHPSLRRIKLIAEPWDIGPGGYQLGRFPSPWREWNDRFRDTARAFWRGDRGTAESLRTAFVGSPEVFPTSREPLSGIHMITCHDGFTLEDLVSFETKRNHANGENNRDGSDDNVSSSWGIEGKTRDPRVLALRRRAKRNLLATLALSRGVPMLSHGDELGRTQRGNNNAYCHDSELTWVDWRPEDEDGDLRDFLERAVALRAEMADADEPQALSPDGRRTSDLSRRTLPALAFLRNGRDGAYLLLLNGTDQPRIFRLPPLGQGGGPTPWTVRFATFDTDFERVDRRTVRLPAHSLLVLREPGL